MEAERTATKREGWRLETDRGKGKLKHKKATVEDMDRKGDKKSSHERRNQSEKAKNFQEAKNFMQKISG